MLPLLLVDGYNLLFSQKGFDKFHYALDGEVDPYENARNVLLGKLSACVKDEYETIVVFDGISHAGKSKQKMKVAGIDVRFSRSGESADTMLEKLATEAVKAGHKTYLATNDMVIRQTCAPLGVEIFSTSKLMEDIADTETSAREALNEAPVQKMTIEDRLDAKTCEKLRAFLRRK